MTRTAPAAPTPPRWYRIASALAVVWMLFGVFAWTMDLMTDEAAVVQFTEGQRQLHAARPAWLFVVYGVAIFSGLAGAAALLLRKAWAVSALALSLAAVVLQFGYTFAVMRAIEILGPAQALPFPLVIATIGILLFWLSLAARRRRWIA